MMKRTSKSSHHKGTNRFKFQTFSERISQINVDVVRKGRQHTDLEECDSYFVEGFIKWQELDCTNDFVNFSKELRFGISTYAQVVHHKEKIIASLKKHLQIRKSLALKALLDLVVQLAKDIQIDFYEVFRDFFEIIVTLLDEHPQDTELLEDAFQCLGYLIKSLWRYLLKDIEDVFLYYAPLLSNQKKTYIHHFAAESLAFLLRKMREPGEVLNFIFQHVKSKTEYHEGVGILMFEVMKGVKRQFHSSAERFFNSLVKKLAFTDPSEAILEDVVCSVLSQTILKMAGHTTKDDTSFVSSVLVERALCLKKEIEDTTAADDVNTQLHGIFHLFKLWLQHKQCKAEVTKMLCEVLKCEKLSVVLLDDIVEVVVAIVAQACTETETLLSLMYSHSHCSFQQIHSFTKKLLSSKDFDETVLSHLVKYINTSKTASQEERILLLAEVVVSQRPSPQDSIQLQQYQPYQLQLSGDIASHLQSWLSFSEGSSLESNTLSRLWSALVCLPNIMLNDKSEVRESVVKIFETLSEVILHSEDKDCTDFMTVVLSQAVKSSVCCKLNIQYSAVKPLCQIITNNGNNISVLQALELWLAAVVDSGDDKLDEEEEKESVKEILPILIKNVSSPYSQVRLHSLSILVYLHTDLTGLQDDGMFQVCLQAERVAVTLHTFRDKLKFLQQLIFVPRTHYSQVPLLYLLGALYVNLSLLWKPINNHIKTLAYEMTSEEFWSILHSRFQETVDKIKKQSSRSDEDVTMATPSDANPSDVSSLFLQHCEKCSKFCDSPDHQNHRRLLLTAMCGFADKAEAKSRILSPLFLEFIKDEYEPTDEIIASSQDLSANAVDEKTVSKADRKRAIKCLIDHLKLFSKFRDAKSMYLEPQLKSLYLKLLCHTDSAVQNLSLQCILTYKYKYLTPYQENLTRLLDMKAFSAELVAFSLDEDSGVVNVEHREQLMPILMRILFGRMLIKIAGKSKKPLILRFLGGCHPTELTHFIDLVMEPVKEWTNEIKVDASCSEDSLQLAGFVPLTKLKSVLDVCSILLSKLFHLMEPYLTSLLNVILNCTADVTKMLSHRHLVHARHIKSLRKIRQQGVEILTQFFTQCDGYKYAETELDAMFAGVVWPVIEKLPQEGVYSPTAVLKMSLAWSNRPQFHSLLVYCPNGQDQQVLGQVMNLLKAQQVEESVKSVITSIIDNLLPGTDEEVDENDARNSNLPKKYKVADNQQCLLLPYVPIIIDHLKRVLQQKTKTRKQKVVLPVKELQILSRLSILVEDGSQCDHLIDLLIPLLQVIKSDQELVVEILKTIKRLVPQCNHPRRFLRSCSKLLSWMTTTETRLLCCNVIGCLGTMDAQMQEIAQIIVKLNAVDRRHLNQPDYNVRFSAFQQILATIDTMETIDLDFVVPVMNNCFYFISKVEDMSLRDNAVSVIVAIIKAISEGDVDESNEVYEVCINGMIVSAVKEGLANTSEVVRFEHIGLLTQLVKYFPESKKFKELKVLEDDNVDKDFFENIKHLQHHRQMRALRRLVEKCQQNQLGTYGLKTFMLPIATSIIFDPNLSKNNQMVMDATAAVGAIAKCLPWQPYLKLLQQYLRLLLRETEQPKTMVKLLTTILDSFHFDLKNYQLEDDDSSNQNEQASLDEKEDDDTAPATAKEKQREDGRKFTIIMKKILPNLNKSLTQKIASEDEHRSVRQGQAGDLEIARIPIAIAMVRLLLALPPSVCNQHLPRIVMKVCHLLKSRASELRQSARNTLIKIMSYLGPDHFQFVMTELQQTLTRGYQKHVLSYTVHAILQGISEGLNHGDLDRCLNSLIQVSNEELFGEVAEEKEVVGITRKLQEAQSSKSYDIYQIIGKYISAQHLSKVINTLKQVLDNTHSLKVVRKTEDVLRKFIQGLLENQGLSSQDMVILVHGIITQTLPIMVVDKKQQEKNAGRTKFQEKNVLLLQEAPKRAGPKPAVQKKTNLHVLVEFGLQLLYMLIKRGGLTATNPDHLAMMDPLVSILVDSMQSKYIKVTIGAVQCLSRLLQFPLPQLKENAARLAGFLFQQLKTHARGGSGKGDNLQLVQWSFKTMTVFIRTMQDYKVTEDQLHVLLSFVEEDIYDNSRQSTAFPLLKAILFRKLKCDEIETVMHKVAELSIMSDTSNIRVQCRQLMSQFLMDYPLGKKVHTYLDFYISQLVYEYEDGRKSALEMLATIFTSFPQHMLVDKAGLFYVPMATGLVNDESAECRKLIALALKTLLSKITAAGRDQMFTITQLWLQDERVSHKQLASQLIGLFVEVEKEDFESRLKELLPILTEQLEPDNYEETGDEAGDKERDHALFNLLTSFGKILQHCPYILKDKTLKSTVKTLWDHVNEHILHGHSWVRLSVCQLYGQLFSILSPQELGKYLGRDRICQLVKDFCQQLHSQNVTTALVDQVVKNLVFLGKMVNGWKDDGSREVDLMWLVKRLLQTAKYERAKSTLGRSRRVGILKWVAGITVHLESEELVEYLSVLLEIVHTELNSTEFKGAELKILAQEVVDMLRSKVGVTAFTQVYAQVKTSLELVKRKRHQQQMIEAVADPERAARKKMKKHLGKREAKKRKILERKPYKIKKRKLH